MKTLYRKGDVLTAIDPCIMEDSKCQALIPGKEYAIFKSNDRTIWLNSEIGEHRFEIQELSEFFVETIKSDNHQIEKLEADKAELLEALVKANRAIMDCDWNEDEGSPHLIPIYEHNQSLIQKHKQ